jgi:hypothetical protein
MNSKSSKRVMVGRSGRFNWRGKRRQKVGVEGKKAKIGFLERRVRRGGIIRVVCIGIVRVVRIRAIIVAWEIARPILTSIRAFRLSFVSFESFGALRASVRSCP